MDVEFFDKPVDGISFPMFQAHRFLSCLSRNKGEQKNDFLFVL